MEDLEFSAKRDLDRALVRQLAVGSQNMKRHRHWADGRGQDVPRVRSGPAGLPTRLPRPLPARDPSLRRARASTR
jgi:hypothetical protein